MIEGEISNQKLSDFALKLCMAQEWKTKGLLKMDCSESQKGELVENLYNEDLVTQISSATQINYTTFLPQ